MISSTDKTFYQVAISGALAKLGEHYGQGFLFPNVTWDLRGKSRLGTASGNGLHIRLNPQYAKLLGRDEYIQTVLHEVCHIVTTQRRNIRMQSVVRRPSSGPWSSHGAEWKRSMRLLGLKPLRCSEVSAEIAAKIVPARRVVRHPVYCLCAEPHLVTPQMFAKINAGTTARCRNCHVVVTPNKGVLTLS